MKTIIVSALATASLFAQAVPPATTSPAGSGALARQRINVPTGPAPKFPSGEPDLSGVWNGGGPVGDLAQGLAKGETIPLLPSAKKIMDARQSSEIRKPTACPPACRASRPTRGASCSRRRT